MNDEHWKFTLDSDYFRITVDEKQGKVGLSFRRQTHYHLHGDIVLPMRGRDGSQSDRQEAAEPITMLPWVLYDRLLHMLWFCTGKL